MRRTGFLWFQLKRTRKTLSTQHEKEAGNADIAFNQFGFPACIRLDPFKRLRIAIAEVVENDDTFTSAKKFGIGI